MLCCEGLNCATEERLFLNDHNDVNSLIEDKPGKFWFATRGNACMYDGKTFAVLTSDGTPFKNIRTTFKIKTRN
ncbi:hypothetical protein GCM10028803_21700 [Larkinella knui]